MPRLGFAPAVLTAIGVHLGFFFMVVLTIPGVSAQYRVPVVFWGSVLGRNDLQPRVKALDEGGESRRLLAPSAARPSVLRSVWVLGTGVDKPRLSRGVGDAAAPPGFATARVEITPVVKAAPGQAQDALGRAGMSRP